MLPYRPFLLCFILYLRALSKYKPPGAYIRRGDLTEGFWVTTLTDLHLEGLIFGILRFVYVVFLNESNRFHNMIFSNIHTFSFNFLPIFLEVGIFI